MAVELAVTNLTVVGPCSGSDADVETSKCSPSLILEIPTTSAIPTPPGRDEKKQRERLHPGGQARLEANSMFTLTRSPASTSSSTTSSSTSTTTSPSSTTTADTSVASDTNHLKFVHDKDAQEQYTDVARRNAERNDARTTNESIPEAKPDTDVGHAHSVKTNAHTTNSSTLESATASSSTVTSSSPSTSLAATSPSPSISSSTSATNLNDDNVDSNGLLSLLRPRFQSNPNLNVKFAPLPELAPRKRKSSTPLGMAARSQLAQRRRMMYRDGYDYEGEYDDRQRRYRYSTPQEISEEEGEADHDGTKKKKGKKKAAVGQEQDEERKKKSKEEDDLEQMPGDPFVSLAKKMGKLWKKMAQSKKGEKGDAGEENGQSGAVPVVIPAKGEEELQSTSERQGGGSRDEEPNAWGPVDPKAMASGYELSPPPPRPSSLDKAAESPIVEKEEEEEGAKTISKAEAPELNGKVAISRAPALNPTPVS